MRSRPIRLLLTCLGTALALAGALALPTVEPTYQERYRPIHVDGPVGQMLTTRDFRIRVRQVVLADSLLVTRLSAGDKGREDVIGTESVWVVIIADVGAMRKSLETSLLEGGEIHTSDGSTYRKEGTISAKDADNLDDPVPLGPTFTQRFFFQVPRDRLTGAYFEVTKDALTWDQPDPWQVQWFLPAARVDLGFDTPARTADALRHAGRYRVPGKVY